MPFLTTALSRLLLGLLDTVQYGGTFAGVVLWDLLLALYNALTPRIRRGALIAPGVAGHRQTWPPFVPPKASDSRSPCPALNAMANHGILPHDGRNIRFTEMNAAIRRTWNFAPTFCFFVPHFAARMLARSYWTGTLDLADLAAHNGIEHDASLVRHDSYHAPDQSVPAQDLIDALLASCTGKGGTELTAADLSRYSAVRRAHAQATNPQFTLSTFHKLFGSSNSATMLAIYGPNKADLAVLLKEERFPAGYEPACLSRMGLTMAQFNAFVLNVELGIPSVPPAAKVKEV